MGGTGIGMAAAGGTTINNAGTIAGQLTAIRANTNVAGNDVINNNAGGTILGDVLTGGGNDTINTFGGSLIDGDIDTGDGNDTVNVAVNTTSGSIFLGTGDDTLNLSSIAGINTADGGAGNDLARYTTVAGNDLVLPVTNLQATGFETIAQEGPGAVTFTGTNALDVRYELRGGRLTQNATLSNVDFFTSAGTDFRLGGAIGALQSGGRLGLSAATPATVNVNGNVVFLPGSVYDVRIAPGGVSDRIAATGTATINGGTVNALVGAGTYVGGDAFTILTAQGGVSGQFSGLTQVSTAFLDISLSYQPNAVLIQLAPNRVEFSDFDLTFNQAQASIPVDLFGTDAGTDTRAVVSELLFLDTDEVAPALDAMSGELHASVLASGMRTARGLMASADQRNGAGSGLQFWGAVGANDNGIDGDGNASDISATGYSALLGADWNFGGAWVGAAAGINNGETEIFDGADSADIESTVLGAYAGVGTMAQGASVRVSYAWASGEADTTRSIAFGGLARTASAGYDVDTVAAAAEVRYGFAEQASGLAWGPVAAVDYANVERGAFVETGADSLNLSGDDDAISRWSYGAGGFVNWSAPGMTFDASLMYDMRDGDFTQTVLRMAGLPGQTFAVRSPQTDDSGFRLSARGEYAIGGGWTIGAGYQAALGGGEDNHAAMVSLTLR